MAEGYKTQLHISPINLLYYERDDGTFVPVIKIEGDVELNAGDIQIGAVELKNAADDTRAKVAAANSVAEGDNALAVQAPVLGVSSGAAVITDANGTLQQYLRGIVKLLATAGQIVLGAGSAIIGATKDAGPQQTVTRTYTASADMTTAAALTVAPTSGQKIVAMDILVSSDTAMNFSIQMETSANVLGKVFLPASGLTQITLRGYLKGDAADKKLFGKASVAGNVAITAVYFSEA